MSQRQPPPEKPHWMSEEDWQDQLEEMRAHAKHIWRLSGGRLDVFPYPDCQEPPKQ